MIMDAKVRIPLLAVYPCVQCCASRSLLTALNLHIRIVEKNIVADVARTSAMVAIATALAISPVEPAQVCPRGVAECVAPGARRPLRAPFAHHLHI